MPATILPLTGIEGEPGAIPQLGPVEEEELRKNPEIATKDYGGVLVRLPSAESVVNRSWRRYDSLFRMAAIVYVSALFYYPWLLSTNGAQPNSLLFVLFFYALGGISVVLAFAGTVGFERGDGRVVNRRLNIKLGLTAGTGLAATGLTVLFPFSNVAFGYTWYGFPLTSTILACGETPYSTCGVSSFPLAFIANCLFWVALIYPGISFVDIVRSGKLHELTGIEGVGVSALLTFGIVPLLIGFAGPLLADLNVNLGSYYTAAVLALVICPSVLTGVVMVWKRARRVGLTVILSSLVLVLLLGISIALEFANVVL
jgi:hypothetical protein